MPANAPQKAPDATCPMCGAKLSGTPAGKAHLAKLAQVGQHMSRQGQGPRKAHPGGYSSGLRPRVG